MLPKELIKSAVQELRQFAPLNECINSGVASLKNENGSFELPDLNDPATPRTDTDSAFR